MAVCQASVMVPLAAAAAAAGVIQGAGACATVAAPPTSKSLLVSPIELSDLLSLPAMVSSLRDPRLPGGQCDRRCGGQRAGTRTGKHDNWLQVPIGPLPLPRSSRYLALQHKAVQVTPLVHVVIGIRLMHDTAIVPQHPVAMTPLMAILIFFLCRVAHQIVDQCQRLAVLHPRNRLHAHGVEIQRLATVLGMRANERVDAGRRYLTPAVFADAAKRARTVLALIDVHGFQLV